MLYIIFSTAVAAAGTVLDEVEPNNSPEQAQMMEKSNVNPSGVVKGDYTGQFVVAGKFQISQMKTGIKYY